MEFTKGELQYIPESTDYIGKQYSEECFKGVIHGGELNMALCVVIDDCVDGEANAHRIVKAVNSHDALYEALKITTELLSYWMPRIKKLVGNDILYQAELRKARKALALARRE